MKNSDPITNGDGNAFEDSLRGFALRNPPATWKASLLRPPAPPFIPKWLAIALAACWAATAVLVITRPADPLRDQPLVQPADPGLLVSL
jgi:hypothetical protein